MITQQEMNLDCLLVPGVDEGSRREDHVLWAVPKSGYDIVP